MNTMLPLGAIRQGVNFLLPKIAAADSLKNIVKHNIHFLHCNQPLKVTSNKSTDIFQSSTLLQPVTPLVNLVCGLKYKGKLKLRCKDCYYVRRFDRLFVMCKSYPRHKQAALKPKERDTWILTYAMSTHKRPW